MNTDISNLYNTRKGTVYVFGAGPSIFYVDPKQLVGKDCIFVNSSALIMTESENNIWISLDRLCLKWSYFWSHVIPSGCLKVAKKDFAKYDRYISKAGFQYFETRENIEIKNIFDNKLCGISSVPAAIDLALKIGYQTINLFGVDQRFIQGRSHFWEFYPRNKRPKFSGGRNVGMKEQKERFEANLPYFRELNKVANNKNATIYNCSKRLSSLDVFPKISAKEGLKG